MTQEAFVNILFIFAGLSGALMIYSFYQLFKSVSVSKHKTTQQWIFEDEYHRAYLAGLARNGAEYEGTIKNKDSKFFVTLHSVDEDFAHKEYENLYGKHVRVTVEVLN
jgi:hypothetical protein